MEKLLTRREVEQFIRLSRSSIYRMMAENRFPRPLRVGVRAIRFRQSDINTWLSHRRLGGSL